MPRLHRSQALDSLKPREGFESQVGRLGVYICKRGHHNDKGTESAGREFMFIFRTSLFLSFSATSALFMT